MEPGSVNWLVGVAAQVPLVALFLWAVFRLMERWDKAMERRDTDWRQFLAEQRQAYNEALGRLAEEIKLVRESLAAHDARITRMFEERER